MNLIICQFAILPLITTSHDLAKKLNILENQKISVKSQDILSSLIFT